MMTKEQFFTFKSDMKKAMRIAQLRKMHRKAYWNDGYATQDEQSEAIRENQKDISSLYNSVVCREPLFFGSDTTKPVIDGRDYITHWAYYCAKHRLEAEDIEKYVAEQVSKLRNIEMLSEFEKKSSINYHCKSVKAILGKYEEIVCAD